MLYDVASLIRALFGDCSDGDHRGLSAWPLYQIVAPVNRLARPAGFPSPAQDYVEGRIDLNRDLIRHPLSTFYVRVEGDSMEPRIHEGALLIVDRMVEATEGSVVIARIGNEFMVKKLHIEQDGQVWLLSENEAYPPIQITEGMDFEVWGRVMNTIDFL